MFKLSKYRCFFRNFAIRYYKFLICFFLSFPSIAYSAAPRIACDEAYFNFGPITNSVKVSHTFEIRNDGDALLVIENVRSSCGCLVTGMERTRLEPGESVPLNAELSLKGLTGRQEKSIYIHSNDPVNPIFRILLVSDIYRSVIVDPFHIVFSQPEEIRQGWKNVTIRSDSDRPLKINGVSLEDKELFNVKINEVKPGFLYHLRVSLTEKGSLPGTAGTTTAIVETDNPEYSRIEIPLSVSVPKEIIVAPSQLVIRKRAPGQAEKRALLVHSPFCRLLNVEIVSMPFQEIETKITRLPDHRYRIDLGPIPYNQLQSNGEIVIKADRSDGRTDTVSIPVFIE